MLLKPYFKNLCLCVVGVVYPVFALGYGFLDGPSFKQRFIDETSALIQMPSYRSDDMPQIREDMQFRLIRDQLFSWGKVFNQAHLGQVIKFFEWRKQVEGKTYFLFGMRIGTGPKKLLMATHIDTVPPGREDWKPFEPRIEKYDYRGQKGVEFLVGRGAIDDKGPAVSAFNVLRALAQRFPNIGNMTNYTVELIFDTSEETDMAMPHYLADEHVRSPHFGVVFDAMWCVRAEKGIERPTFYINRKGPHSPRFLWVDKIETPPGPVNQIPSQASVWIKASTPDRFMMFDKKIRALYQDFVFDDPHYSRAALDIQRVGDKTVKLTAYAKGAQHGSVPQENRSIGVNPLVSLLNFIAGLSASGELDQNEFTDLARFAGWGWGTRVFGERHSKLLKSSDKVFGRDNGTTYALTRLQTTAQRIELLVDVRYALGHHRVNWDGKTEGLLPGQSRFAEVFAQLTSRFNSMHGKHPVLFKSRTLYSPDVRLPENKWFQLADQAFQTEMGKSCPMVGIGGGTDAKGHPSLIATGPLFGTQMGPPVNYHGIYEGAPVEDMLKSTRILFNMFSTIINKNL